MSDILKSKGKLLKYQVDMQYDLTGLNNRKMLRHACGRNIEDAAYQWFVSLHTESMCVHTPEVKNAVK